MSSKALLACALLILNGLSTFASPLTTDTNEVLVNTPGGPRPQSQVHHVPLGARIHHTSDAILIISESGEILHTNPLTSPSSVVHPTFARDVLAPSPVSAAARALSTGYVAYTYFTNNSVTNPISSFTTSWTVPPVPKTNHNQLLYLFSALTPASGDAILQPVLQYGTSGAGGGNYWATASWYLVGSSTYHSTLVPVQPGAVLGGVLTMTNNVQAATGGNITYTYSSSFTHSPYTTVSASTTEQLNWAWAAFEIYSATSTSDLPTGTMTFSNITMNNLNGQTTPLQWSTRNDTTDGLFAQVKKDGSPAGEVAIVF